MSFAVATSQTRPLSHAAGVQRRPARCTVMCAARQQEQKPQENKVAKVAAAGLAALMIAASPVFAEDSGSLKNKICATNPTSKICLLNSSKK